MPRQGKIPRKLRQTVVYNSLRAHVPPMQIMHVGKFPSKTYMRLEHEDVTKGTQRAVAQSSASR